MIYSQKFRLYPTPAQEIQIHKTFDAVRFVYNHYLAKRIDIYKTTGETYNFYNCCKDLTQLKKQEETSWLKEADSSALIYALRHLDTAYQNFFRHINQGATPGYPKFKNKDSCRKSYTSHLTVHCYENSIKLPKVGIVKARGLRQIEGRFVSATISQDPSGKYHMSIRYELAEEIHKLEPTGGAVGLHMGIKEFAVSSDGHRYTNPKYFQKSEEKLEKLQHQLSKKTKGSKNYEKARKKLAKVHEQIANQRMDMQHKLSTAIIRENDLVAIRDIQITEMLQDSRYAKAISDAGWGEFQRQLEYKAGWYGREIVTIDNKIPVVQLCSRCGEKNPEMKDLRIRTWVCPKCQTELDRSTNAAMNILMEGLRQKIT